MSSIGSVQYSSFFVSHDAEADDLKSLVIANRSLGLKSVMVDCQIGNPAIAHSPEDPNSEMETRLRLTNLIFSRCVAVPGAKKTDEVSEIYVTGILNQSTEKKCLVLHTASFKSLESLFSRAGEGALKNVTVLTYGSVNCTWAFGEVEEKVRSFYQAQQKSGATLYQIEGFPFLGKRNKLSHKNTPLTYFLLSHFDGPVGQQWKFINDCASEEVRYKQAAKIAVILKEGFKNGTDSQKKELYDLFAKVSQCLHSTCTEATLKDPIKMQIILNQSLTGEDHDKLVSSLKPLKACLFDLLKGNEEELSRPFNIYEGVTLSGQALIADQLPAILFSELLEGREHGIARECRPVRFEKMSGRFPKYAADPSSSLYYLETKKGEEARIDSFLEYIDLHMAVACLSSHAMISASKRAKLLSSPFKDQLDALAARVKKRGFDSVIASQ